MDSNEAKNAMKVMVVSDLSAICRKLAEHPALPENLRANARQMVEEFDALIEVRGKGNPTEHSQGEALLIRMARFLPRVVEVQAYPADAVGMEQGQL